jgi:hypothetical protein
LSRQLGDDKLDIRLGGIYALERIAVDSKRDHATIVEVLSAYVRERTSPVPLVRPIGRRTAQPRSLTRSTKLTVDTQAALTVLGRLPVRSSVSRGDVSGANLAGAELADANLSGVKLIEANLSEVNFQRSNLRSADLSGADLTDASLYESNLARANLRIWPGQTCGG